MAESETANTVPVGKIGPVRGLKGEVLVRPLTDYPDERFAVGQVLRDGQGRPFEIVSYRVIKNRCCLMFADCSTREAAQELRGIVLYGEKWEDEDDDFTPDDLVGLEVYQDESTIASTREDLDFYGTVTGVVLGEFQDRIVVETGSGEVVEVPFVEQIVTEIDLTHSQLFINPPQGLFSAGE